MDGTTASVTDRLNNPELPAIIIGEIGSNFGGTLDSAKAMIRMVADAGCDFAKFQIFRADLLVQKGSYAIRCLRPWNCRATGSPSWSRRAGIPASGFAPRRSI
jgi:sialic acid synthase SpsE